MKKVQLDLVKLAALYSADVQTRLIAEELCCSKSLVERHAKELGLKKIRTGPKSGAKHTNWKGGRKFVKGYWYIYKPDHPNKTKANYVLEHRLVMEQKLERHLLRKEVVHHADGNSQNNDPTNLVVFPTNGAHLSEHFLGNPEQRKRIAEGMQKSPRWNAIRNKSKPHVQKDIRPTDHPTSQSGNTPLEASEPTLEHVLNLYGAKKVP